MKIKFNCEVKLSKKDLKEFRKMGVQFMDKELMQELINKNNFHKNNFNRKNK